MPKKSDILIANTFGFLRTEASLRKMSDIEFQKDDKFVFLKSVEVEEAGQKWNWHNVELLNSLTSEVRGTGFVLKDEVDAAPEGEGAAEPVKLDPVPLKQFARLIIENSYLTGSNPGVLLALAYAESGPTWKKSGDTWADASIEQAINPDHKGVGPFQFRPQAWEKVRTDFPGSFEVVHRFLPSSQARAAALVEQKFFERFAKGYMTLDLFFEFILGAVGAKAFRDADENASVSDLLSQAFSGDSSAVQNELNWRAALFKDGERVKSKKEVETTAIALLDDALKEAEDVLIVTGLRQQAGNRQPTTPTKSDTEAPKSKKRMGDKFVSSGNPETRVAPDLVVLARSSSTHKSPKGHLVEILQAALASGRFYTDTIDGDYGPNTESAVRAFQERRGHKADGKCRAQDWQLITGLDAPSLFDRCLHLTASYEGTGFTEVLGNWDDAVMTWGIIGFTLNSDSDLSDLIRDIDDQRPGALEEAFGDSRAITLRAKMKKGVSTSTRLAWVKSITKPDQEKYLDDGWTEGFRKLGEMPAVQKMQIRRAQKDYWSQSKRTIPSALLYGARDELDVGLLYDTSVQNGGIAKASRVAGFERIHTEQPDLSGAERRRKWVDIVARAAKIRYRDDVKKRKSTFANGGGVVHGARYQLADWGLGPTPITEAQLTILKDDVDIAYMPDDFGLMEELAKEYLAGAKNLPWLQTAMSFKGVKEAAGRSNNPTIMGWARGIGGWIWDMFRRDGDAVPWCGLFVGHCMRVNGIKPRATMLSAKDWANFGTKLDEPAYGCVLVFKRTGGGHVGFYVSEDNDYYHVLGGNQTDQVNIIKKSKSSHLASVWPTEHMDRLVKKRISRRFDGKVPSDSELA